MQDTIDNIQNLFSALKTTINSMLQDCYDFTCHKLMNKGVIDPEEEILQDLKNRLSEKFASEYPFDDQIKKMLFNFEKELNSIMETKTNQILLELENKKTLDFLLSELKVKDNIFYRSQKGCIGYAMVEIPSWEMISIGTNEGDIYCFDTKNFELVSQFQKAHSQWIMCLAYNEELNLLFSSSTDKKINVYSIQDKNMILIKCLNTHTSSVNGILFIPNKSIFISFGKGNEIKLWNKFSLLEIDTIICDEDKMGCQSCYVESLESFGIGFFNGKIKFFNIDSRECIMTLTVNNSGYYINSLLYDPISKRLISQINSKKIGIWKLNKNTFELEGEINVKGHANNFILLNDFLLTCCDHPNIEIWNVTKQSKVREIPLPPSMRNSNGILIFHRNNAKYLTVSSWNVNKLVVFEKICN